MLPPFMYCYVQDEGGVDESSYNIAPSCTDTARPDSETMIEIED